MDPVLRLFQGCWGWCLTGLAEGPILARTFFPVRPFKDEEVDSEDERDETMHYFKEAVNRSQEGSLQQSKQNSTDREDIELPSGYVIKKWLVFNYELLNTKSISHYCKDSSITLKWLQFAIQVLFLCVSNA